MKLRNIMGMAVASLALVACVTLAPPATFLNELNKQYNHLSTNDGESMRYEWANTIFFKDKASRAAAGKDVQPEEPKTWNVPSEYEPELVNAYDMLQIALVPDQKKVTNPVNAAQAQAYFDCWVEQSHRKWTPTNPISDCRAAFYKAMCRMYNDNCHAPVLKDRIFRVYFDTDSSVVGGVGHKTIAEAVAAYKAGATQIVVAGHADRQGSGDYNLALSKRRAGAVKNALVSSGIPAAKINGKFFGEEQPIVVTPDNTPNANNRRVLIVVR